MTFVTDSSLEGTGFEPSVPLEVLTVGIVPCRLRGPFHASLPKTKFAADSAGGALATQEIGLVLARFPALDGGLRRCHVGDRQIADVVVVDFQRELLGHRLRMKPGRRLVGPVVERWGSAVPRQVIEANILECPTTLRRALSSGLGVSAMMAGDIDQRDRA